MSIPSTFDKNTTGEEVASEFSSQIEGRVVLITGTTWGSITSEAARIIAVHHPKLLILVGRKEVDLQNTKSKILEGTPDASIRIVAGLDLGDLEAVRRVAAEVNSLEKKVDVVINSAGIMAVPYSQISLQESQFIINHLGPFLLTNLLLLNLSKDSSPPPRIVVVSSDGHHFNGYGINLDNIVISSKTGEYDQWDAYFQSKAANVLYASELRKWGWEASTLEPGTIWTGIAEHLSYEDKRAANFIHEDGTLNHEDWFWKTPSQGAATFLTAAFAPSSTLFKDDDPINAPYIIHNQVGKAADFVRDERKAERLWAISEDLVGQKFEL